MIVHTPQDTIDIEGLLYKINAGKELVEPELAEVAALMEWILDDPAVAAKVSVDDVYSLALVLGRAKKFEHRHLIERYLDSKDPLTVALVLEMLCLNWGSTDEYLERVINFALGVPIDVEDDIRHISFKILGEHLYRVLPRKGNETGKQLSEKEKQVLELLFNVLDDGSEEQFTRQAAYFALCRAAGKEWEMIPSEYSTLDLSANSSDMDMEALSFLRKTASNG